MLRLYTQIRIKKVSISTMKNIGIDLFSFDLPGKNYGVGPSVYVWNLLPHLLKCSDAFNYVLFVNKDIADIIPRSANITVVVSPFNNRIRALRILHEQFYLPYQFYKHHLSLMHYFGNNISYLIANKSIITIYDLMWKYFLGIGYSSFKIRYFQFTVPLSIRVAKSVITISNFICQEVKEYIPTKKNVFPILLGPGAIVEPTDSENLGYSKKYTFPYIFTVSTSMPNKNLVVLLKAFEMLKRENNFNGKLLIAGQLKGDYHFQTQQLITLAKLEKDILLLGFISEGEKTYCYRNAIAFVYTSLYEGFGLPPLEAMQCGVPVIVSNAASIPEVVGDAGIYFNPKSADDLLQKIKLLLNSPTMAKELIERGQNQVSKFSWEQTGQYTLQIYKASS